MTAECHKLFPAGILSQRIFVMLPCGGVGVSATRAYTYTRTDVTDPLKTQVMWESFHLSNCITEQQTLHG